MKCAIEKIKDIWDTHSTGVAILAIIGVVICAFACVFGLMCLRGWLAMLLWNWVVVGLFHAPALSFWMAFGLSWLCSLLFKGTKHITHNREYE